MQPEIRTYRDLLTDYQQERADPAWRPVMTGFGTIDAEIRGISPGQVLGIAARTAVGKTWLLNSIEHNFSARTDAAQLSLSLEMPGPEWAERALAIHDDVPPEQVEAWARQGELLTRAAPFLDRMRNSLVVETAVRLEELSTYLAAAFPLTEPPIRLVLIDYLGMLGADGRDVYDRASRIGKGLKDFAKREKVAVVVAVQLSRAGGTGGEPVRRDMLRDSGVIEESLDFLLGCWRPGLALTPQQREAMVAEELEEEDDRMIAAILKNRKGKEGRWVDLRFRPGSRRLYEPADPFQVVAARNGERTT